MRICMIYTDIIINPKNYLKYKILNNKIYPCLDLIYI